MGGLVSPRCESAARCKRGLELADSDMRFLRRNGEEPPRFGNAVEHRRWLGRCWLDRLEHRMQGPLAKVPSVRILDLHLSEDEQLAVVDDSRAPRCFLYLATRDERL